LQTHQNHVKAESQHRSSKRRPNFTSAEVEVLLQKVDVSILFHYGYIHAIEFSAYRKSSNSGWGFYLLRLHSAPACIWGRLVLWAGLYFLLIIRLFRMFQKVPLI